MSNFKYLNPDNWLFSEMCLIQLSLISSLLDIRVYLSMCSGSL